MISMYSDAALEQSFDASTNVRSINLRREAGLERHDFPAARNRSEAAGFSSQQDIDLLNSKTLHHDSLDAARGMSLAVVLGVGCWMVIGGIVRIAFF